MKKPFCILFAGMPGCSKTPVAYYLSWNLGLPIFNNDAIRTEVAEDTLSAQLDKGEHLRRRDERMKRLIESKIDFILDVSIDRTWPELRKKLEAAGYDWFIINYELSTEFLIKLYEAKNYKSIDLVDGWKKDHELFMEKYQGEINFTITEETFQNRLEDSLEAVKKFISKNQGM